MQEVAQLGFFGGTADEGLINAYDLSRATQGFTRVLQILGHYHLTGRIIHQAPSSTFRVFLAAPEAGSFKQSFYGTLAAGVVLIGMEQFIVRTLNSWIPEVGTAEKILEQEIEQTKTLKQLLELQERRGEVTVSKNEEKELARRQSELDVIRSITAQSFRETFRPVEQQIGPEYVQIYGGPNRVPTRPVSREIAAVLESDVRDGKIRTITARVTGFSRTSKTGTAWSETLKRGLRFEYRGQEGKLPVQDIFSRSQFYQEEIILEGEFIHFFDGTLKKMIVYFAGPAKSGAIGAVEA